MFPKWAERICSGAQLLLVSLLASELLEAGHDDHGCGMHTLMKDDSAFCFIQLFEGAESDAHVAGRGPG